MKDSNNSEYQRKEILMIKFKTSPHLRRIKKCYQIQICLG